MKKIITLLTATVCLLLLLGGNSYAQWANNAPHIFNTNAGNVGISNGALWAPAHKLHINTLTDKPAGVMCEYNYNLTPQKVIGYYRVMNSATGDMLNISLRKNGANHEMLQSCFAVGFGWREYTYLNYTTGKYEMRNGIGDAEFMNTGKFLISSGGNTGIGTINPLEKLEVNGAVRLGGTVNNNAGTIQFNGANFLGFDGANWLQLDNVNQPPTWIMIPNPLPAPQNNFQLYPVLPPSQITNLPPGLPNPTAWIYSTDVAAPGLYPHQLTLEAISIPNPPNPPASASQLYQIAPGPFPGVPIANYSAGLFIGDLSYKVCKGPVLTPTFQGDGLTMLRADPLGIIDLPNQSRVRAYQVDQSMQTVPSGVWTPVNYTFDAPLPVGYDQQNAFAVAPAANAPWPPEQAYFTALAEGYYQVNARCQFEVYGVQNPGAYVSIAIWTGPAPGATAPYAQGNNLQIFSFGPGGQPFPLEWNNAPNVSDVVYLMTGQVISIWVFQNSGIPLNLIQGHDKCYVSIHKVS